MESLIKTTDASEKCCQNTDVEIWRECVGDFYSDSIHVTKSGGIGINCGGHVIVAPVKKWHELGELMFCVNDTLPFVSIRRKLAIWLLCGFNKKRKNYKGIKYYKGIKLWNR